MVVFRTRFGWRQGMMLLPAVLMAAVGAGFYLWGDRQRSLATAGVLGMMVVLWLGMALWRALTEHYAFGEGTLVITQGPQRIRVPYGSIVRVLDGDVTLPGSRMARGALLIQQENAPRGHLVYPADKAGMVAGLKTRAPQALFITSALELAAYQSRKSREKREAHSD
jgi:hypothetical protein